MHSSADNHGVRGSQEAAAMEVQAPERDDHLRLGSNCSYLCLSSRLGRAFFIQSGLLQGARDQSLQRVQECLPDSRYVLDW